VVLSLLSSQTLHTLGGHSVWRLSMFHLSLLAGMQMMTTMGLVMDLNGCRAVDAPVLLIISLEMFNLRATFVCDVASCGI
jgi:hypothetical protein